MSKQTKKQGKKHPGKMEGEMKFDEKEKYNDMFLFVQKYSINMTKNKNKTPIHKFYWKNHTSADTVQRTSKPKLIILLS